MLSIRAGRFMFRLCLMSIVSLVILAVIVGALVDIITRPDDKVKHLPKIGWILLVVFLPLIGSLVWFMAGHDYGPRNEYVSFGDPRRREPQTVETPYGPPERGFRTTEQELADLEAEIEFHEKQARIDRLEARLSEKRERPETP
jgi:hypothetical protein